jgi:hypothetical protein
VAKKPVIVSSRPSASDSRGDGGRLIQPWQDRFRDPALTVLLILGLCTIFLAVPLAAKGLPTAQVVADTLVLAVIAIVVMLSLRWSAIILILLGVAANVASLLINAEASAFVIVLRRGGDILTFSALTWVVAHAVYAPGRITLRRLQGAIVMYLNFASIFTAAYGLIWELSPGAFANLVVQGGGPEEIGSMLYFSFTTLTTTGYGDIVAVDHLRAASPISSRFSGNSSSLSRLPAS